MKRGWIVALTLGLLLAGAGAWWLLHDDQPANQPISLLDGSVIFLRGATYGTNHHYQGGGVLGKLARLLPGKWKNKLGGGARVSNPTPSLTVWVERRGAPGPRSSLYYALGTGTNFSPASTTHSLSSGMPGGASIEGWGFSSFPRRGQTMTLRVYDRGLNWGDPKLVGEFTVRNPAFTATPGWQAEDLPATKKVDDFEVTLKEVFTDVERMRSYELRVATNVTEAGLFARLALTRNGRQYEDWTAPSVQMSDATGNKASSSTWTGSSEGKDFTMLVQPYLWADESAWRMKFELSRTTNFSAPELWTLRGVPLGGTNLTNQAAYGTNLNGARVRILSLASRSSYETTHELRVVVHPDRSDYRLTLVEARDDRGRLARREGSSWGGGNHSYSVGLSTNAQSLDVTLSLHQSRYVEFLAKPTVLDETTAKREREKARKRK